MFYSLAGFLRRATGKTAIDPIIDRNMNPRLDPHQSARKLPRRAANAHGRQFAAGYLGANPLPGCARSRREVAGLDDLLDERQESAVDQFFAAAGETPHAV